jgi:hypothetical protein
MPLSPNLQEFSYRWLDPDHAYVPRGDEEERDASADGNGGRRRALPKREIQPAQLHKRHQGLGFLHEQFG